MTGRSPFRPLCRRTVASKGFCTPAELQPTSAGARWGRSRSFGLAPGASDRRAENPLRARKSAKQSPRRTSVRYWEPSWSGVRAAEGARLEIAWAGSTCLEGSNPSHSVSTAIRVPFRRVPGRIAQRESARFTRGRSLVQSQVRPSPRSPCPPRSLRVRSERCSSQSAPGATRGSPFSPECGRNGFRR